MEHWVYREAYTLLALIPKGEKAGILRLGIGRKSSDISPGASSEQLPSLLLNQ